MGYALLWLEGMASALLLVATVFSFLGRLKKRQALWPILMAMVLFLLAVLASTFSGFLFFRNVNPQWLFPYTVTWTLVFPWASWMIIRRGRPNDGEVPAATWPRTQLVGALIVVLTLQWVTMDTLDNARKLEAVTAQTTALSKAQTILPSPPPYDQDASAIYDQAIKELGDVPNWLWDNSTNPAFDPKSDQAQTLLQEKKKAIQLFKEATRRPHHYHPLILSFNYPIPSFHPFQNASRLLALEARSHARDGQTAAALDSVFYMRAIADHLLQTPTLITIMVAGTVHVKSKKTLEIILAENTGRSAIQVNLPVKARDHLLQAFHKSLVFEDSFLIFSLVDTFIRHPWLDMYTFRQNKSLVTYMGNKLYRIFLLQGDLEFHEAYWEKMHGFSEHPYYEVKQVIKDWETHLGENTRGGFLTSIVAPAFFSKYHDRVHQHKTQMFLADLGLAAAAYHARHQKYPSALDALVPEFISEIPRDPFDGKPLKMTNVDEGLILYGIGPDLKDDGGAEFDDVKKTGDLTFCLGTAYEERRMKPALEKMSKEKNGKK